MDEQTRQAWGDAMAAIAIADRDDVMADDRGEGSPDYLPPAYVSPDEGGMLMAWPVPRGALGAAEGMLPATDSWKAIARAPLGAPVRVALPAPVRLYDGRLYGPAMTPLRYRDGMVGTIVEHGGRRDPSAPVRVAFPDGITLALDPWHLALVGQDAIA